jgi:UDP-4-amino-4,6-dideoxy-N-acetyl-beta-L-altrosamine transaminase
MIPYGKQKIEQKDIEAVIETLNSNYLTQGPKVKEFEKKFGDKVNNPFCTAVCNATAGLHIAYEALGLGRGDLLWTVPNTFVATANAARFLDADVDFVDIDPDTFCISIEALKSKLANCSRLPKIVVPVHFAGSSADMKEIHNLSMQYGFKIVEDAAHAVGTSYDDSPVGSCKYSDAAIFSFHPVKIITTGEGGIVAVKNQNLHQKVQQLITHGITKELALMENKSEGAWFYEMQFLGYNYRMTDIQAALGISQLSRLDENIKRRKEIAENYTKAFSNTSLQIQKLADNVASAFHLFVVLLPSGQSRKEVFDYLHSKNIKVQVHYIPVHTQPYYKKLGFNWGDFINSEEYYKKCISLPMYHSLTDKEQDYVIETVKEIL